MRARARALKPPEVRVVTRCESSFYESASERAYKIELYTPVISAVSIPGYFEYYLSVADITKISR